MARNVIICCSRLASLPLCLLFGCGYLENDGIDIQKQIVGKIFIEKQKNSPEFHLAFKATDQIFTVIVANCSNVYYDSSNRKIYVESSFNQVDKTYFLVDVKNSVADNSGEGVEKKMISRIQFERGLSSHSLKSIL